MSELQKLREQHGEFYSSIKGLNTKALLERKPALVGEIRKMADAVKAEGGREFTGEEDAKWRLINAHYDVLEAEIKESQDPLSPRNRADRLAQLEAGLKQPSHGMTRETQDQARELFSDRPAAINEATRLKAFGGWIRSQMGQALPEDLQAACNDCRINPNAKSLTIPLLSSEGISQLQNVYRSTHPSRVRSTIQNGFDFRANLSQQIGGSGAYLTPPETLVRELETNLLAYGGMRQVAETITTATGERLSWPTADDTTNQGAQLGENTTIGNSVDPTFSKVYWDAYMFSSTPVLVPFALLQDSVFSLVAWLGEALGVRLGRVTNSKYTTGTGAATPKGIITAATSFSAAGSSAITADDLLGLIHSIDPAYRTMDCGFMCHDSILLAIRKLKDGDGQYLWQPGMGMGVPDRLFGYNLTNNQSMDSTIASGKKTVLFGRLSNYKIRRVGEMRFYRLEERYRDSDQDGFIAFIREDGNLLTAGTAPVKYLSH